MDVEFGYNILTKTIPIVLTFAIIIIFFLRKAKNAYNPENSLSFNSSTDLLNEERREPERVDINLDVKLESAKGNSKAILSNLSISGAFVKCNQKFSLSDKFTILLENHKPKPLAISAEIIWSNLAIPGDHIVNRGVGVRFINNPQETRKSLESLITKHVKAN